MNKLIDKFHDFQYDNISGAKVCTKCGVNLSTRSLGRECYGRGRPFGPAANPKTADGEGDKHE
jgi:hypothetical protein